MQRGAIALRFKDGSESEKGVEGYGSRNVSILRVFTNRVKSNRGCPSKQAESSSRITVVGYKHTCKLLSTRASTKFLKQ